MLTNTLTFIDRGESWHVRKAKRKRNKWIWNGMRVYAVVFWPQSIISQDLCYKNKEQRRVDLCSRF